MILHDFTLSSASYRVRIALALKGVQYERRSYLLRAGEQRAPEYLALNPAGLVPTLEVDGLKLTQSLAIIDWLDATYPTPRLVPSAPAERARVLEIALTIACDIHPLNNLRVLKYLENKLGLDDAARNAWYGEWVALGFSALEALLQARPDTRFAAGDAPGLADICILPQVYNARRFKVDLSPFPRVAKVADTASAHPAFRAAAPADPPI